MNIVELLILLAVVVIIGLQLVLLARTRKAGAEQGDGRHIERLERELRLEMQSTAQATRQEVAGHMGQYHAATVQQLDGMRQQMQLHSTSGRE